jgi:hypothetical protein
VNIVDSPDHPSKIKQEKAIVKKTMPSISTRPSKENEPANHIQALTPTNALEFVRTSSDKKYDIYSYTFQLQTG